MPNIEHPAPRYLKRSEAAEYVSSRGLPTAKTTLAKLVTVGGGPVYQTFGRLAVYTAADLDAWIASRLSDPRRSTTTGAL